MRRAAFCRFSAKVIFSMPHQLLSRTKHILPHAPCVGVWLSLLPAAHIGHVLALLFVQASARRLRLRNQKQRARRSAAALRAAGRISRQQCRGGIGAAGRHRRPLFQTHPIASTTNNSDMTQTGALVPPPCERALLLIICMSCSPKNVKKIDM